MLRKMNPRLAILTLFAVGSLGFPEWEFDTEASEVQNVTESNIGKIARSKPKSTSAKVTEITNAQEYLPIGDSNKLFVKDIAVENETEGLEYVTVGTEVTYYGRDKVRKPVNSLEWMANLYNPHLLGDLTQMGLEEMCVEHMNVYLEALKQEEIWAAKMTDANGKYSSQFFFGNQFWLGSEGLCHELSNTKTNKIVPPFPVGFWVVRLLIKLPDSLSTQKRLILQGLCLPKACSKEDVTKILLSRPDFPEIKGKTSVTILNVRPVPGSYSVLRDIKFQVLGGSFLLVIFFMIIGTTYEYVIIRKNHQNGGQTSPAKEFKSDIENNNAEKRNSFDHKTKTNIYEVNKKELTSEEKKTDEKSTAKTTPQNGILSEVFLAFSLVSNAKKIITCSNAGEDSLTSVHGLRFFSLAWVILVHTYLQLFAIGGNKLIRSVTERSFMYQTIGNATFSVDSFFFISGLLVSYLYFKNEGRNGHDRPDKLGVTIGKFLTLVVYRFIRLTPVYIVVLGMIQLSMRFINNISVFEPTIQDHINCEKYWWRNILYVNNMFPRNEMCMLWSWYMATDTQFFVLSALILLLARKHFKFSAATLFIVLISSWCTTAFVSYTNQYEARVQEPFALFDELYDKPWTRIGPYIVGMCAGWILYQTNCKIKMSVPVVIFGWGATFACLLSLVYGLGDGLAVGPSSAYVALGHTAWGLSLAWIVVACRSGYGGWVNSFLSCSILHPLSRLTYCAYLVHPLIMVLTSYVMDGPFHIHNGLIVIIYLGNLVASFLLSFLLSLAFEAPIVRLLKLVMSPRRAR